MGKKKIRVFGTPHPDEELVMGIPEGDDVELVEVDGAVKKPESVDTETEVEPDVESEPAIEAPELSPDTDEDIVDEDVEGASEIDPPIKEEDIPVHPDEDVEIVDREPTTWEWMAAGITQLLAHSDKYQAGQMPFHDKPSYTYMEEHGEELAKDPTTEQLASDIMMQRTDRAKMIEDQKDLIQSDRKLAYSLASGVTKALMFTADPTLEQLIQEDPAASKIHNTVYFGTSMLRDYILTRGLVKGGGALLPHSAGVKVTKFMADTIGAKATKNVLRLGALSTFEGVQATTSGVTVFNELESMERTTGKEAQAELNGILTAGISFTAGMVVPEALERGAGLIYKWLNKSRVAENILSKSAAKLTGAKAQIAKEGAKGFIEGSTIAATESIMLDKALLAAGERGTGGAKWESVVTAGLFSTFFRAANNWHLLKQEGAGMRENLVEKFVENTRDIMKPIDDPSVNIVTRTEINEKRLRKTGEELFNAALEIAKITGDPDMARKQWRTHQVKKVKNQNVVEAVKTEARRSRAKDLVEVTAKLKDGLSGYWYQKIKNDKPDLDDKGIKSAYNKKMKSPLTAWGEKIYNETPVDASKSWAIDAEMKQLNLGDDSLKHAITKTFLDSKSAKDFSVKLDNAVEEVHNMKYLDSLVDHVNRFEKNMGFEDTKTAPELVRELRGIDDPKEVIHSVTEKELGNIGQKYMDALQSYKSAESKMYSDASERVDLKIKRLVTEAVTHPIKTVGKAFDKAAEVTKEAVLARNLSEDTDLIIKLATNEYTKVQAIGLQKEFRAGNVIESRARNSFVLDEKQISQHVHDNGVDMVKARAYADEMYNAQLKGELTPEFQRKVSVQMDLSLKDIAYARKMGNFSKQNEDLIFEMDHATPDGRIDILKKKKNFDEISDADEGNWYHPRQWSDAGKAALKAKEGIDLDDQDFVNSRFGRTIDSMALGEKSVEHRLTPGEELSVHFAKTMKTMALRGQNKAVDTLWNDTFGMKNGREPYKLSDVKFRKLMNMDKMQKAVYLLARGNRKMQQSVNYINPVFQAIDNAFGVPVDNASMLAIGSLAPVFLARNSVQGVNNGLPYLYGLNPIKASKDAAAALGRFPSLVIKGKGYQEKYISGLGKDVSNPEKAMLARVFDKNLTDTHLEYTAMSNFGVKQGIGLQIRDMKKMDSFGEKAVAGTYILKDSLEHLNQIQLYPLGASDLTARVTVALRSTRYFDEVLKRNMWQPKNAKHAQKKYNKITEDLHFDIMGEGRRLGLEESFDASLKTGDFTEFKDLYAAAWVERLCFGYGINDAPRYQNEIKPYGRSARIITRFTNWSVKNRHNLVGIVEKSRKKNFVPLLMVFSSTLLAYGMHKAMKNYIGEDNEVVEMFDKYGYGSTYGSQVMSYDSLIDRAMDPTSLMKSTYQLFKGTGTNAVLKVSDELGYDLDMKESSRSYGLKVPSTDHIIDAYNGTNVMFDDMVKMFGSKDEFINGVKASWDLLTEDIKLLEED